VAADFFERASDCLDRGEADRARGLIDEGLELDPNSEEGRHLLEHVLRREGRFEELLERLLGIANRAVGSARASALKDAARLAAGPLLDPSRAMQLYFESLRIAEDESVLAEAVSRGVRHGLLDVGARLLPEMQANLRAEHLSQIAQRAEDRGDLRLALECRAAAFADAPTRARWEALDRILSERGDVDARVKALALYAEGAPPEERVALHRAMNDPSAEADALIELIRAMPLDAPPEAILERLERVSTAPADQAILAHGLAAVGDRELVERGERPIRARAADRIELDTPLLPDTQGDGLPLGPREAVQLHLGAGDTSSLIERIQDAIDRDEEIDRATWLRAGRFLSAMGRVSEARQCLLRATGERASWDRAAAEALAAQGDHREAARALLATEEPTTAADLRWLGELYFTDGDEKEAVRWLERAREVDPKNATIAVRLLELSVRANQNDRVEELLSAPGFDTPAWHLAAARALRRKGDPARAHEAVKRALASDPVLLEPAVLLFDLGRERSEDAWIDRALAEIRARALVRGERSRAFVAAGLLVARGAASDEDRLTYEGLRIDLSPAPRATLPQGWADRWLVHVDVSAADVSFDEKRARPVDLEPGLLDALEAAEGVFGVSDVRVVALVDEGPPTAVWDDPPHVGFANHELVRWLPKTFRFEVGRALAALTEPRLRGGLVDAQLTAEGTVVLLDRAGLVVAQDPVPVLEAIGAKTPRGRALTAFAVSDELYGLWSRIGLGVVPPHATVAKPSPSA
jgi:tetratricopeptide (TPR) repeat protein